MDDITHIGKEQEKQAISYQVKQKRSKQMLHLLDAENVPVYGVYWVC